MQFYCLAGQDTPVVSDRTIAWMLGRWDRPLERRLAGLLDTPMQGLLSTLLPLADALRSVQETLIATVSDQGKEPLDWDAPQYIPLVSLGGAFRLHIIRAFVARFREFSGLDTPVTVAGPSLRAYAAAHAAAANPSSGDQNPLVRFARARGTNRLAALTAIVGEADATTPGLFPLEPPPRMTQVEHPCLMQAFPDEEEGEPVSPRLLAMEVESLRELTAALLDEAGTGRLHAEGAFAAVTARLARVELRAPGEEQLATVDDIQEYSQAAARMVGAVQETHRKFEARMRSVEATLRVLAMSVATGDPVTTRFPEINAATQAAIRAVEALLATPEPGEASGPAAGPGAAQPVAPPSSRRRPRPTPTALRPASPRPGRCSRRPSLARDQARVSHPPVSLSTWLFFPRPRVVPPHPLGARTPLVTVCLFRDFAAWHRLPESAGTPMFSPTPCQGGWLRRPSCSQPPARRRMCTCSLFPWYPSTAAVASTAPSADSVMTAYSAV